MTRTTACPVCTGPVSPGWLVCQPCAREVPGRLMTAWLCASHHHHAARNGDKPTARIMQAAETERLAAEAVISHLRQHGSAL